MPSCHLDNIIRNHQDHIPGCRDDAVVVVRDAVAADAIVAGLAAALLVVASS